MEIIIISVVAVTAIIGQSVVSVKREKAHKAEMDKKDATNRDLLDRLLAKDNAEYQKYKGSFAPTTPDEPKRRSINPIKDKYLKDHGATENGSREG